MAIIANKVEKMSDYRYIEGESAEADAMTDAEWTAKHGHVPESRIGVNVWDADVYGDGEKSGQVASGYATFGADDEYVFDTDVLLWSVAIPDPDFGRLEDDWFELDNMPGNLRVLIDAALADADADDE
jgi:hypothetical protein